MTPNAGGVRPPPRKSIIAQGNMSTKLPFLLWMRVAAQIVTAIPVMAVNTPDTLNLGISVIAASPAKDVSSGQACMIIPLETIFP